MWIYFLNLGYVFLLCLKVWDRCCPSPIASDRQVGFLFATAGDRQVGFLFGHSEGVAFIDSRKDGWYFTFNGKIKQSNFETSEKWTPMLMWKLETWNTKNICQLHIKAIRYHLLWYAVTSLLNSGIVYMFHYLWPMLLLHFCCHTDKLVLFISALGRIISTPDWIIIVYIIFMLYVIKNIIFFSRILVIIWLNWVADNMFGLLMFLITMHKLQNHFIARRDCSWHPYHSMLISSTIDCQIARMEFSWNEHDTILVTKKKANGIMLAIDRPIKVHYVKLNLVCQL